MSQRDWAVKEIEIAMQNENPGYVMRSLKVMKICSVLDNLRIPNQIRPKKFKSNFDYGCACYESAYKAFLSLCNDGHSGMSFGFTKHILEALMDGRPLTPIEDVPEEWGMRDLYVNDKGETIEQCKRMSSLFKCTAADGKIRYSDINRTYCKDLNTGNIYSNSRASDIINELFPIVIPYSGTIKPFVMYCEECLTDRINGDYDTTAYWYFTTSDGTKVEVNRFFAENPGKKGNERWTEITVEEWCERYNTHLERIKKEEK